MRGTVIWRRTQCLISSAISRGRCRDLIISMYFVFLFHADSAVFHRELKNMVANKTCWFHYIMVEDQLSEKIAKLLVMVWLRMSIYIRNRYWVLSSTNPDGYISQHGQLCGIRWYWNECFSTIINKSEATILVAIISWLRSPHQWRSNNLLNEEFCISSNLNTRNTSPNKKTTTAAYEHYLKNMFLVST